MSESSGNPHSNHHIHTIDEYTDSDSDHGTGSYLDRPLIRGMPRNRTRDPYSMQNVDESTIPPDSFWSLNVSREAFISNPNYLLLTMLGCPCLVGNPFSKQRKKDCIRLLFSFLFWISLVDVIYFVVELIVCGAQLRLGIFLAPKSSSKLIAMGAKVASKIQSGQVHRLILPIMMHGGVIHILFNLIAQLSIGLGYERHWGTVRTIVIYTIGGIAGNLLSCFTDPVAVSLGASGAILALVGAKISQIFCMWHSISYEHQRNSLIFMFFILFFTFFFTLGEYVDVGAHIGGLFMGFSLGFLLFANQCKTWWGKAVSAAFGVVLTVVFFVVFGVLVGLKRSLSRTG